MPRFYGFSRSPASSMASEKIFILCYHISCTFCRASGSVYHQGQALSRLHLLCIRWDASQLSKYQHPVSPLIPQGIPPELQPLLQKGTAPVSGLPALEGCHG